jgi:hypothetical protein
MGSSQSFEGRPEAFQGKVHLRPSVVVPSTVYGDRAKSHNLLGPSLQTTKEKIRSRKNKLDGVRHNFGRKADNFNWIVAGAAIAFLYALMKK